MAHAGAAQDLYHFARMPGYSYSLRSSTPSSSRSSAMR